MNKQYFIDSDSKIFDKDGTRITYSAWILLKEEIENEYRNSHQLNYTAEWINSKLKVVEKDRPGYVYLIKDKNYKIGRTKNIESRIRNLQTACDSPIRIICWRSFPDHIKAESVLKKLYQSSLKHGEWFVLSKKDIEVLKEVLTTWTE